MSAAPDPTTHLSQRLQAAAEEYNRDVQLPHAERLQRWGHRAYVGGNTAENWYAIGRRQYHYLVSQGLRPEHVLLDIGCGSLRLGQFVIPMLNQGNYYGIDGEPSLVELGIQNELLFDTVAEKKPNFAFNYDFDFGFVPRFDYAIAQSLFTHLDATDTLRCLRQLRLIADPASRLYFTFSAGPEDRNPAEPSHPHRKWTYRPETLHQIAADAGWTIHSVSDWGHERRQLIALATTAPDPATPTSR